MTRSHQAIHNIQDIQPANNGEYAGYTRRRISFGGSALTLAAVGFSLFLYTGSAAFLVALLPLALFGVVVTAAGILLLLELAVKRDAALSDTKTEPDSTHRARRKAASQTASATESHRLRPV